MSEARHVVLIGTHHPYQIPGNAGSDAFGAFLALACSAFDVRAIAEEMSTEALLESSVTRSVAEEISESRALQHRYCDPNSVQREELGIVGENTVRIRGFFSNWDEAAVQTELRRIYAIREGVWADQLIEVDAWPTLFVCGCDHVSHFRDLLRTRGIKVSVLARNWDDRPMPNFDTRRYGPPGALDELVHRIRALPGPCVVGIDGRGSAGKTTLARWLSQTLGWHVYQMDWSLAGDGSWFDAECIETAVTGFGRSDRTLILEGSRLLDTVPSERIQFLIHLDDVPPCAPTGRTQREIETYLQSERFREARDFHLVQQTAASS